MPFGLKSTPRTFQNIMNMVFFDLSGTCVVIYLDELLIFSKIVEEHKKVLDTAFACLAKH